MIHVTYNFTDETTASRVYPNMDSLLKDLNEQRDDGFIHYRNEAGSLTLVPVQHLSHIDVEADAFDPVYNDMVS